MKRPELTKGAAYSYKGCRVKYWGKYYDSHKGIVIYIFFDNKGESVELSTKQTIQEIKNYDNIRN